MPDIAEVCQALAVIGMLEDAYEMTPEQLAIATCLVRDLQKQEQRLSKFLLDLPRREHDKE